VATDADRIPDQPTILLGKVNDNPAMLLLYARYFTPADGQLKCISTTRD